ncbi:glycosyl transferase [Candidatus Pelagibacter sp.]|nr:glycosyl transferase [Candidatus Pelagibacter sp.]
MGDFSQNGIVSTLHDFGTKSTTEVEKDLLNFSKERKMELILPCLYSELEGSALPNIVDQISKTKYLNHVIIGLDKASESQAKKSWKFFKKINVPFTILWNDGPKLKKLDNELKKKNLAPNQMGKGRNVWYCIGMCIARDTARSVALHDCDIKTYDRRMLAKLFYPVVNPLFNFEFCKGYYPRIANNKMNGRVARLLVGPLLTALEKTIGQSDYLNFMKSFKYPLAGEFSFRRNVLPELRISSDWGIEVGILSEMQRSFSPNNICQVDLADAYDHKHQDLSIDDETKGLSKMSIDIIKTFIKKLATQGNSFSRETFRSLKATYYRSALDLIDIYRSDAAMNGLKFDSHKEEEAVELFAVNIMKAGEAFYINPMDTPFIPTWSRVKSAIPDFLVRLNEAVSEDNKKFI